MKILKSLSTCDLQWTQYSIVDEILKHCKKLFVGKQARCYVVNKAFPTQQDNTGRDDSF